MYKRTLILLTISSFLNLIVFSCKEKATNLKEKTQNIDRSLPGFYDINFNTLFSSKENHSTNDELIKKQINDYFDHVWLGRNLSGGLLVARGNTILFEKYTGFANIETKTPLTSTTPMHVASVSKILTSLIILKLTEADKISLNQKVITILPSFPYPEVTIENLLNHRSGLPNYSYVVDNTKSWDKSKQMTNNDVLHLFITQKPDLMSKPGTHFSYSNTNFALLALIAEKITKKPFPEIVDKMIFKPLGMKHSYIFQKKDLSHATPSYYANGKPYPFDHLDLIYGDKNLYTTPEDLLLLSQAMYAPNFLRKDLLEDMFTASSNEKPGIKNYGLGVRMMVFDNGKKITYHTGWWHGSNAIFIHLLDEKVTIIAIGNRFSKAVYSALRLSSLFGDYPLQMEDADHNEHAEVTTLVNKILDQKSVSNKKPIDSIRDNSKKKESKNTKEKLIENK